MHNSDINHIELKILLLAFSVSDYESRRLYIEARHILYFYSTHCKQYVYTVYHKFVNVKTNQFNQNNC